MRLSVTNPAPGEVAVTTTPAGDGFVCYAGTGDGWTEIGRTEGGITWLPERDPDVPEYPLARLSEWSVSVTVPLTRAGLRWFHLAAHGELTPFCRCGLCNPGPNPRPLPVHGREYRRRQQARRRHGR
jgi:hypothetical protein